MEKYKIQSYELQDKRWGAAYVPPTNILQDSVIFSEPFEFNKYFKTKKEADEFTLDFLKNKMKILDSDIEITNKMAQIIKTPESEKKAAEEIGVSEEGRDFINNN